MHVPQTDSKNLFSVTGKWSLDPSCPLQTERFVPQECGRSPTAVCRCSGLYCGCGLHSEANPLTGPHSVHCSSIMYIPALLYVCMDACVHYQWLARSWEECLTSRNCIQLVGWPEFNHA